MSENQIDVKKKDFTILDYINILKNNKKTIIIFTVAITVMSIIVAFFIIEPIYQSVVVVKTASSKSSGLGALLGGAASSSFSDIADIGDITGGGSGAKELALYESILNSRRNIEEVIIKYKLNDEWEFKYMQDAVRNFRLNIIDISKDKIAGTLAIGIYDKNPQRAKDIVDFMVSQLNKINIELNVLNAKNNREYIEQRYILSKTNLKKAEDSLRIYQDIYGIAPDIQTKVATETELKLEAEIKTEEVKLDLLKKIISPDQTEVKIQEEKIKSLNKQLGDIRNSSDSYDLLSLKNKPSIVLNYLRLVREVEIQNKIVVFLLPLYEQAKIEENKQTPTVLILDQSYVPERKAKPKRINIVFVCLFISFFLSYCYYIIKEKWNYYKIQKLV
jgi:tyrosine-protein kinase Etk/Wzc